MKIAIIGGIGSGKSEVLKIAESKGAYCVSADSINDQLLHTPEYVAKLSEAFPCAVKDGVVDKRTLAKIVFADRSKRELLNSIAHPEIMQRIYRLEKDPYVVEVPSIIESGSADYFDEIILVYTPLLKRLIRLKKRGMGYGKSISRIRVQPSERELKKLATVVINNGGDRTQLYDKANAVFDELLGSNAKSDV